MKQILFFFLTVISFKCLSQENRLSINLYSFSNNVQKIVRSNTVAINNSSSIRIHPSLGYTYVNKKNLTYGFQIGLFKSPYKLQKRSNVDIDTSYFLDSIHNISNAIFFRLAVGKETKYHNYFFNTSASIPFLYNYIDKRYFRSNYYLNDNSLYNSQETTDSYPKYIETGLCLSQSIGYKILKSLSVSVEFNAYLRFNVTKGTRIYNKTDTYTGSTPIVNHQEVDYKHVIDTNIDFFPVISINYSIF
jgi:hypothetical protein